MNVRPIRESIPHCTTALRPEHAQAWKPVRALWQRILSFSRRPPRRLRLCESLPLGERRFVAVVEFEESRFLLGGTSASLVLLARLDKQAIEAASSDAPARTLPSTEKELR
jgi:flagellar biogenesis protein FliO